MQIKKIVLYNNNGEKRILSFEIGKVNIITGESTTGKTALIDIINYCLCSSDCSIAEGVIRDTVEWFGLLLQLETEQVFVARQNPNKINLKSTINVYFSNSDIIVIPELNEIQNNSDIETLKDFFTKKLFISEYQHNPISGTRDSLSVNFKHSKFYSFQPQDLIAQRQYLFYNQTDQFIPQTIKDTLPYFLGVIREDNLRIENAIESKKREISKYEKILSEYERLKQSGSKKIFELIDEAKELNLLSSDKLIDNESLALEGLREVLLWENNQIEITQGENENLKKILEEKHELSQELSNINDDLNAVKSFINYSSEYSEEVKQQQSRLESIKLIIDEKVDLHSCPLCSQKIQVEIPSITAINKSLRNLVNNFQHTLAENPKLNQYVEKLNLKKENLKIQIDLKQNSIKAIYLEQDEAVKYKDLNLRKGKIIGKISLFLESFKLIEEDKSIINKIYDLKKQIETLENLINLEENENKLNAALNHINTQMTNWASKLDLEFPESPIRFDIKKLTLYIDTPNNSIPLFNMGGGANWVNYHLLIHFSLHKYFIKSQRPVPRFLIIDQPSQIYFPPEKDINQDGIIEQSSDEKAVEQMYKFIFEVTNELTPNFQVIITDHAKLNFEDFQNSIIEEWRYGKKLIPLNWIKSEIVLG